MYVYEAFSAVLYTPQIQRVLAIASVTARVDGYDDSVTRDERFSVETEREELAHIIHFERPRLPNRNTVNRLPARDVSDFNNDEWMRIDQLEFSHLDFGRETSLVIVNSDDGMMAEGDGSQ